MRMVPGRTARQLSARARVRHDGQRSTSDPRRAPCRRPPTDTFTGFRPEAIQFLVDLAENNDRAWFRRARPTTSASSRTARGAVRALDERFHAPRHPALGADPARSPFRIYRDVRFSKDKSPYKTNVSASFPWAEGGAEASHDEGDPGGYFHLAPGEVFVGGGMWHPPTAEAGGLPAGRRRRPRSRPRRHRRASRSFATFGQIVRREADSGSRRASRRTIPRPTCSSTRT